MSTSSSSTSPTSSTSSPPTATDVTSTRSNKSPLYETLHIIGLTGGIASGKSTSCSTLEEAGCYILNADKLGHLAYLPGSSGYYQLLNLFGKDRIISETNSDSTVSSTGDIEGTSKDGLEPAIDRGKLGAIVFNDEREMKKLTSTVWPIIERIAREEILAIDERNKMIIKSEVETGSGSESSEDRDRVYRIVVVEAAILLEAQWDLSLVDEVWTLVVPEEVAISRLKNRNNFSVEEGKKRVRSQITNELRISKSQVVIDSSETNEKVKAKVLDELKALKTRLTKERGFSFPV